MRRTLAVLVRVVGAVIDGVVVALLIGIVGVVAVEAVARTWFARSFAASEELALLFLVWATFLYLGRAYEGGVFIRMHGIFSLLPPRARVGVEIAERVIAISFAAVIGWRGWEWTRLQYELGVTSHTSFALPRWLLVLAVPVGATLFVVAMLTTRPGVPQRILEEIDQQAPEQQKGL